MDLPTCPACGQSVLDEDVTECPFCGASMSGRRPASGKSSKPAAKPSPAPDRAKLSQNQPPTAKTLAPPAGKAPNAAKSLSTPAGKAPNAAKTLTTPAERAPNAAKTVTAFGGKKPEEPLDPDDDPFELERQTHTKAIPAVPKRVQGRSYKVVCPMCETVGYVPRQAAGRDVRCANPKCSVPVFKAPLIVEERSAHNHNGSFWSTMAGFVTISLIVIAILGGSAWFFLWRGDPALTTRGEGPKAGTKGRGTPNEAGNDDAATTTDTPEEAAVVDPHSISRDEILRDVLPMMTKASIDTAGNRSKPLCRRLAADAAAIAGAEETAQEHLAVLREDGASVAYYRIPALVTIGWAAIAQSNAEVANKAIDESQEASQSLPQYGRDRLDVATMLAAVLVRIGEELHAREFVRRYENQGLEGQLSALLCSVRTFETFDLDEMKTNGPLFPWILPQSVAVTNMLAAHLAWDDALAWARAVEDPDARAECVIAWATAWVDDAIRSKRPESLDRLSQVAEDLAPAARAQLFARVAFRQALAGDTAAAEKSLERAQGELAAITVPPRLALPELEKFFDAETPDISGLRMAAAAAAEIARVEAHLGKEDSAGASLDVAMNFLRGLSPSLPSIRERLDAIASTEGRNAMREQLKELFRLTTDDAAIRKYNDYRTRLVSGEEAATKRFQLQTAILMQAIEWGLVDPVWETVRTRVEHRDIAEREPYYDTDVPWALADAFRGKGDAAAEKIESTLTTRMKTRSRQQQIDRDVSALLAEGKVKQAAARLSKDTVDESWRATRAIQIACKLAREEEKVEPWFEFIMGFEDARYDGLREDALDLCSALTSRRGHSRDVWGILTREKLTQTEKSSLCHGLIAGAYAVPEVAASESPSQSESGATGESSP